MLGRPRILPWLTVLALLTFTTAIALADDPANEPADGKKTILVTIRLGHESPGEDVQSYQLSAVDGGERAKLVVGSRVPIPTTTFNTSQTVGGNIVPVTSYTYQSIGFSAEVRAWVSGNGNIRLDANIEDSSLSPDSKGSTQPTVTAVQQRIQTILSAGSPLRLQREGGGRSSYLEIEASVVH